MFGNRHNELDNDTRCYQAAINYLARREHSRLELINKLSLKPFSEGVDLHALCDRLEASNYLSNERFADMFVRSRIARGQGEMKIRFELRQRGITDALADTILSEADVDWLALAMTQREKRFGEMIPKEFKERGKQSRFLASRGFSGEVIGLAFSRAKD